MTKSPQNPDVLKLEEALIELRRSLLKHKEYWLKEFQLTRAQVEVLWLIAESTSLTMGDLARQLVVTPGAATQTLSPLISRGLVLREADPSDHRLFHLRLSAEGQGLYRRLRACRLEQLQTLVAQLSAGEIQAILSAFAKFSHLLDQQPDHS